MVAVALALPRPDEAAQPADVAFPVDTQPNSATGEEKTVDGRHHHHHGKINNII